MACIFADGFDYYQGGGSGSSFTGDLGKRYTGFTGSGAVITIGPPYARTPSGQGCLINGSNTGTMYKAFGSNYTQGLIGVAMYSDSSWASRAPILLVLDGTTEQISLRTNASSVPIISRAGTTLATGSTVLATGTWYYFELKFTIHNTTGVVELKINGVSEIASTGSLNTRSTANTQWNGFAFQFFSSTFPYRVDDVYVLDTSTGANTTFLGPVRVVALAPSAPGNYAQWTANGGTNMGNVSEAYEDGDGSFNQSATANQIDTFVMQDLPASSGSVFAVQHVLVARQDAGAARTIAVVDRISGSDYVGTTQSLSTSYQFLTEIQDLQPVGGTPAWDTSTVAAMEAGYKLIS